LIVKNAFISRYSDLCYKYSNPPNTEPSGIQMVIFRKLFVSRFQMVAAILFLPFEIRTRYFLTSLDRFGMNKIFFYDRLLIKQSRLATGHKCPVFGWSGYQMSRTGIRLNPNTDRDSVFGGLLYWGLLTDYWNVTLRLRVIIAQAWCVYCYFIFRWKNYFWKIEKFSWPSEK
jgi:hypothetical protein